jgi:hypothetical protein
MFAQIVVNILLRKGLIPLVHYLLNPNYDCADIAFTTCKV